MKKTHYCLFFILSFFPFLSCSIYAIGFLSLLSSLMMFCIVALVQFKYICKPWYLALCGAIGVISVGLAIQINTQLYISRISDDWASLYIGNVSMIASVIVSTTLVLVAVVLKYERNNKICQ